jgi:hypothetical protein
MELLSPEGERKILSWRHTAFSALSWVMAKTEDQDGRINKHMLRQVLSREQLPLIECEYKLGYNFG